MILQQFNRPSSRRHVLLTVSVLALLLQALIPTGFMPRADAGTFALQICDGHHAGSDAAGDRPVTPLDSSPADTPCAFSVAGGATAPPDMAVLATASASSALTAWSPTTTKLATTIVRAHGARAPPFAALFR